MGFKQAAVLAPVSFFLGVLFICFSVDYRLLWGELTEEVISDGFQFYATFYRSPPAIKALLHGMVGVGVLALVAKLFRWDDSAMFFDGTSIGAYVLAIAVYATVTIPTLKTVVEPLEVDSHEDRILALRVLSASNVITIMLLGVLLTLQAGQEYARRADAAALVRFEAEQRKVSEEKKTE